MLATPVPSPDEARDNASFDALLWALSRPGLARNLPEPGEATIIAALLDRECRVYAHDPLLLPAIMRTGAEISDFAKADHVFLGAIAASDIIAQVAVGSDLYPDDGATVVVRGQIGHGMPLRLTGPGVDGALTIQLNGLPDGFWTTRTTCLRYPMGFDLFVLDGAAVLGIPRSTKVEVL